MLLMLTIGIIFQEAVKLKMGFKLQFISKALDSQFSIYIMSLVQENIFSQLQYLKSLFTTTMPKFCQIDIMIKVYMKVRCSFCIKYIHLFVSFYLSLFLLALLAFR